MTFLSDAIEALNIPAYEALIRVNHPLSANAVATVDEFLAAVYSSGAGRVGVQPGTPFTALITERLAQLTRW